MPGSTHVDAEVIALMHIPPCIIERGLKRSPILAPVVCAAQPQVLLLVSAQATRPVRSKVSALAAIYAEDVLDAATEAVASRHLLQVRARWLISNGCQTQ